MAGQLTIDTLRAGSGVLATQNGMTGIPKAWAYIVGSTSSPFVTLTNSFNVSSITRVGAGAYYVDFVNSMPNANYSVVGTASLGISYANFISFYNGTTNTPPTYLEAQTASRFYFCTYVLGIGAYDPAYTTFSVLSS
jgi:hypothetical protein